jgi:hypothetical protein
MPISRELAEQIRHLLRPLATRIGNTVARGVVKLVDDSKKMQLVQIGVLAGEPIDGAEHFQSYGFTSVPLEAAEHVTLFPNGDRSHPIVVAIPDRRYRPTNGKPGEVTLYHYKGAKVRMLESGDIEIQPGPGGQVFIRDEGGNADRLVKVSEFNGHTHPPGSFTAPAGTAGGPVTGVSGGAANVAGTERLRSQ